MPRSAGALACALLLLLAFTGAAAAATPVTNITSAGPLTKIALGRDLSCQVERAGAAKQLYPNTIAPGDCGTFAMYDNTLYRPDFTSHGGTATSMSGTVVTPVSQSAVTGTGTSQDPFKVVTIVTAGSKLRLTQTETYISGQDWWTTNVAVKNLTSSALSTSIYRGMDCYLGGSDQGYGFTDAPSGGAGCATNANNTPVGLVEALIPAPGHTVRYFQDAYNTVWQAINAKGDLAGTCKCANQIDNGVAVQWALALSAQQTQVVSFNTVFDPAGNIPAPPPGLVPPSPSAVPAVPSGTPARAQELTGQAGTWTDATSVARQWQSCTTTSAASCTDIAGATSLAYTPVGGDVGRYLRLVEVATNADGTADAASGLTSAAVVAAPPAVTTAPVAGTAATRGTVLHGQAGTWTDATSTTVRWQRCTTTAPASCSDITAATALDYTPVAGDVGQYLRLVETATNADGSTSSASALTSAVAGLPPVSTVAPSVPGSGPARQGVAVTGDRGTWTDAISYTYAYQRCASTVASTCTPITGATTLAYTPAAADAGAYLRLAVTATNPWGSTTAYSALGDRVLPAPPVVVTVPGTTAAADGGTPPLAGIEAVAGDELRPDTGAFTGVVGAVAYQYQRCATDDPAACEDITGATAAAYIPTPSDAGFHLRLVVTATNPGGTTVVSTPMTGVVRLRPAAATPAAPTADAATPASDAAPATEAAPVPAACVSRRSVTLHWKVPAGARPSRFTVTIDGRTYATVPGARRDVTVRLSGRPSQTVVVRVAARTAAGHTIATTRTYRTCRVAQVGAPLKTLRLLPVARA